MPYMYFLVEESTEKSVDVEHDENKHSKKHGHRAHFGPHKIGKSPDHFREKIIKELFGTPKRWKFSCSFLKHIKLIGKIADLGLCQKEIERQVQPRTEIFKQTIVTEICFSHNWRHALADKCEKSKKLCIRPWII